MPGPKLSAFVEDSVLTGRVLENGTDCVVDAVCYLRIEFADSSIVALYGTGERPTASCQVSRRVSDAAFNVERGEIVEAVVSGCGPEGRFLRRLTRLDE